MTEADGTVSPMFPNEARLRNLTFVTSLAPEKLRVDDLRRYAAPLYVDMKKRVLVQDGDGPDPDTGEMSWTEDKDEEEDHGADDKIYIGKVSGIRFSHDLRLRLWSTWQVPIMLRSEFCILDNLAEKDQYDLNECPYDKVRFIVLYHCCSIADVSERNREDIS